MEPKLSQNALLVLEKRYLKKDEHGTVIETPQELFMRVSSAIAQAERIYGVADEDVQKIQESFYSLMTHFEFMPNSPTLMNAGKELGQLSACFVLPIEDSMDSIFESLKATALIHKSGGGTGFNFSRLRPKNSVVRTTGGVASGPVSFMKVFDAATQAVKQGGTRRGANMGILRVDHPDILEFIQCKEKEGEISNFNISIAITDEFMEKVVHGGEYALVDPHTHQAQGTLSAQKVFDLITEGAHRNGEPGIVFIDKINANNPVSHLGAIESTNPCGEQPLLPYESCNLGSINLAKMVKRDSSGYIIDWDRLKRTVNVSVRFLDNVIDMNRFPLPEIGENTKKTRKIGLGVMGWATLLCYLGIPYDSEEALNLAEKLMAFILKQARLASSMLAKEKGVFPAYRGSIYDKENLVVRNATLTTLAPTGTISIIAGPTSSGIEPIFALVYYRKVLDGQKLAEIDPAFEEIARKKGFYSEALLEKIAQSNGSIKDIQEIPEEIRRMFVTALDIDPVWHIRMQAAFQKYTDNAVSKTINLPSSATLEDVKEAYLLAYKLGCKGVTVYRDKSRQEQVLNIGLSENAHKPEQIPLPEEILPKPRPEVIIGTTTKVTTGCGNLYVTINQDEKGSLFEVFTQMGKAGGCAGSQLEAVGRLISLSLRGGLDIKAVVEQLKGIRCPSPSWANGKKIFSCADAIARVLERRATDQQEIIQTKATENETEEALDDLLSRSSIGHVSTNVVGVCPECGLALRHEEGCVVCLSCGYSKC